MCLDEELVSDLLDGRLDAGRLKQVVEHIGTCETCRDWVVLALKASGSGEAATDSAGAPLTAGTVVGRYVVLQALGTGGMGVVYAAFDPQLDRKIALKLLRPDVAEGDGQARLLREAQALARLSHPHVVAVHDVGTWDSQVFVAMEFADAGTLTRWLRERPRPWREIVGAFSQAGAGLAAAHAAGLLHRDFKPDNVLVSRDGRFRVTDFGLARPKTQQADLAQRVVLGTPAYMSPEQRRGEVVDDRSDQYSFCVALHEALFGSRPTGHGPQTKTKRVPQWLSRVVQRGLSESAAARFPSMIALLEALALGPVTRRRWAVGAVVVCLVGAGALGYRVSTQRQLQMCRGAEAKLSGIWDAPARESLRSGFVATGDPTAADAWDRTEKVLDAWASGWMAMHTEACEATRLRGEQSDEVLSLRMACLQRRLEEVRALTQVLAHPDARILEKSVLAAHGLGMLAQCADITALRARVPPPADPRLREKVEAVRRQLAEARTLLAAGKYPEGLARAQAAESVARDLGYPPLQAEVLETTGWLQHNAGDSAAAERTLREAVWIAEAERDDEVVARAATELSYLAGVELSEPGAAQQWSELAEAVVARLGGSDELTARLLTFRGATLRRAGDKEKAVECLTRALALAEKALGPRHPLVAQAYDRLGAVLSDSGRYEEALALHRQALALNEAELGPAHPHVATSLLHQGKALTALGKALEAIPPLERALAIRQARTPNPVALGAVRFALARALWEAQRDRPRALSLATEAVQLFADAKRSRERDEVLAWLARAGEP
jgi:tetratricopeptide (TPR) repeat protein/tRNA A-37 threonylcarbamoyl transferase component Bud32